jgi:type IX secretion system PorP/SprF family membrane protein
MRRLILFSTMVFLLAGLPSGAQDLHFSQFYLHPQHQSPASAGAFHGSLRMSGIYRSQWRSVPVNYQTYGVAADWKAIQHEKSQIALGVLLQQDQAGDGQLSWTQGGVNLSTGHKLGANSRIAAGFGANAIQRTVNLSRLSFKNQWNGDNYDPTLPSGEPNSRNSGLAASLSAGLHFSMQSSEKRTGIHLGMGGMHLNRPEVSFGGLGMAKLPIRWSVWTEGLYEWRSNTDLLAYGTFQTMHKAREIILGAGIRQFLTTGLANLTAIRASIGWRPGDAIIPAVQIERNNWLAGISYDLNISDFDQATNGRGGVEIAVVYRIIPVEVSKIVKCCPIF